MQETTEDDDDGGLGERVVRELIDTDTSRCVSGMYLDDEEGDGVLGIVVRGAGTVEDTTLGRCSVVVAGAGGGRGRGHGCRHRFSHDGGHGEDTPSMCRRRREEKRREEKKEIREKKEKKVRVSRLAS